jgi:hypothetical protein
VLAGRPRSFNPENRTMTPLEQALIVLLIEGCLIGMIISAVWKW